MANAESTILVLLLLPLYGIMYFYKKIQSRGLIFAWLNTLTYESVSYMVKEIFTIKLIPYDTKS